MRIVQKYRWLLCGLYAVGMLGLSILPASALAETPELLPHQDKVVHAMMYGGWAVLLGWVLQSKMRNRLAAWMIVILLMATAYGAVMEILQGSWALIQRSCSWGDMLANLAGAILGIVIFALCAKPRLCMANVQN